jgi:hypothetical protein
MPLRSLPKVGSCPDSDAYRTSCRLRGAVLLPPASAQTSHPETHPQQVFFAVLHVATVPVDCSFANFASAPVETHSNTASLRSPFVTCSAASANFISKTRSVGIRSSCILIRRSVFDAIGRLRTTAHQTTSAPKTPILLLKAGTQSPCKRPYHLVICIVMNTPCTVVYRNHSGNNINNLVAVSNGIIRIAAAGRRGDYPGGYEARAYIGGRAASFAYRKCWGAGKRKLAIRLVMTTSPMIIAALWNIVVRLLQTPTKSITVATGGSI